MSIDVFCEHLSAFGADRAAELHREGTLGAIFAFLGPENEAAANNRSEIARFREKTDCPIYGWWVTGDDQEQDVGWIGIADKRSERLAGWVLDIESALQGDPLGTLIGGTKAIANGRAVIASLAGTSASHVRFDYRTLDHENVACDWQSYMDSGEGPNPASAVAELYQASFVVGGWEYRHRLGQKFGWSKVKDLVDAGTARVDSYLQPGPPKLRLNVGPRVWGNTVTDHTLRDDKGTKMGALMGRATYRNIRVTLDTTRGANDKHSLAEWSAIAASARWPGSAKRKISVYLAEKSTDPVLRAIAAGAR